MDLYVNEERIPLCLYYKTEAKTRSFWVVFFHQSSIPSSGKTYGCDFKPRLLALPQTGPFFCNKESQKIGEENATEEFLILQLKTCRISCGDYC